MKLVLVSFEVAELRELLVAAIEPAGVRFGGSVHDFVRADVAVLGEGLAAEVAGVGPFTRMAALVGFEVAETVALGYLYNALKILVLVLP